MKCSFSVCRIQWSSAYVLDPRSLKVLARDLTTSVGAFGHCGSGRATSNSRTTGRETSVLPSTPTSSNNIYSSLFINRAAYISILGSCGHIIDTEKAGSSERNLFDTRILFPAPPLVSRLSYGPDLPHDRPPTTMLASSGLRRLCRSLLAASARSHYHHLNTSSSTTGQPLRRQLHRSNLVRGVVTDAKSSAHAGGGSVVQLEDMLRVTFEEGSEELELPYMWLRDNCPCPLCFHPVS